MANLPFKYPLDLTSSSPENRVINEPHTIGAVRGRIFVPQGGPFYGNKTVIRDIDNNRDLVPRVDYYLIHYYEEAAERTNEPVYAAVRIVNRDVSTRVAISTQYVGGEFGYVYAAIVQAVRTLEIDGRPINWGDLVGTPSEYNPAPHLHDIRNSYNWNSVVDALDRIAVNILEGDVASHALLLDMINNKFEFYDQWRDEIIAAFAAHVSATNSAITALDTKIQEVYFPEFRKNLRKYLESTPYKGNRLPVAPATKHMLYPPNVNTVDWTVDIILPSTINPLDGETVEIFAARDGCTVNFEALNGPIRRVINNQETLQLQDSKRLNGVKLGSQGIKLVWDARNGTWNLIEQIDYLKARFDTYSLKDITTSGELNLALGNCFVLTAGANRMVSFTNIPMNRALSVTLTVRGNGVVMWPNILWVNGQVPVLSSNRTVITLYRSDNTWFGTWQTFPA